MYWARPEDSRAAGMHAPRPAGRVPMVYARLTRAMYPWVQFPPVQPSSRIRVASPGPPIVPPRPPRASASALQQVQGVKTRKVVVGSRPAPGPSAPTSRAAFQKPSVISPGHPQKLSRSKRTSSRSASVPPESQGTRPQGSRKWFLNAISSQLSQVFKKKPSTHARVAKDDSSARCRDAAYGRRRRISPLPNVSEGEKEKSTFDIPSSGASRDVLDQTNTDENIAHTHERNKTLLSLCQSLSPCLSPHPETDDRDRMRPESQNEVDKRRRSSLPSGKRSQRPSGLEGPAKKRIASDMDEGGFRSMYETSQLKSSHTIDGCINAELVSSDRKGTKNTEHAPDVKVGRSPRSRLDGIEPPKSKHLHRLNYAEEVEGDSGDSTLEDLDAQTSVRGAPRIECSRRWKWPPVRPFRRADGPLSRPRRWSSHLRARGTLRPGCYSYRPSLAAGELNNNICIVPSQKSVRQLCTCYAATAAASNRWPQTSLRPCSAQDIPTSLASGWRGREVFQGVTCKACDAVRCNAYAQRRYQLQERLRAEERTKHLEEETAIHQRSRREEIVRLEEIKEEEETARLERELLLGELWQRSNRREFVLNPDGADSTRFQQVWLPVDEAPVKERNARVTTAKDMAVDLVLQPLGSRSELFFVQDGTSSEKLHADKALGNELNVEQWPAWHRRRCSAVDVRQPSPDTSGNQLLPARPVLKQSEHQSDRSKQITMGGAFLGPFAKQFSWNSAYFLQMPASRYSQEESGGTNAKQVRSASRDQRVPSKRGASVKLAATKSQQESGRRAHSDELAATEATGTSNNAEVQPEPGIVDGVFPSQSSSTAYGSIFSADALRSFFSGETTSIEKEQGRAADADGQTTGLLSTIFLTSTLEEDGRVMRETGEPIQHDVQPPEQRGSASKAKIGKKSSDALSSTQFETAAGESAMQATKNEASVETKGEALKGGGAETAIPAPSPAANKVAGTFPNETFDTFQETRNIISDPAILASSPTSPGMAQKSSAPTAVLVEAPEEIEEVISQLPAPKEAEMGAPVAGSSPLQAPVEVFSGSSVVCAAATLVVFWVVVVLVLIESIPGYRSTSKTVTPTKSTTVQFSAYLCDTQPCLREGEYLKALLDGAERPCTNFYHYVCERWSPGPIAAVSQLDKLWSRDTMLEGEMEAQATKYLTSNPESVRPLQALLQACNDRPLASSSVAEMHLLFRRWRIEGWPLPAYTSRPWDDVWILAGEILRDVGLAAFADVFLATDPSDDQRSIITIDLPEPLHFEHLDAAQWPLVRSALQEALSLFDVTEDFGVDKFLNDSSAVFDVVEVLYQSENLDDSQVVDQSELEDSFRTLIACATRSNTTGQCGKELRLTGRVLLLNSKFARALPSSLRPLPTSVLLNHLGFRALVRLAAFLPESVGSLRQLSLLEAAGRSEKPDTMSLCLRTLERAAPGCFARALAASLRHSGEAILRRHWLSDLETALLRALPRLSWLDEISKAAVAERIRRLHLDTAFFDGAAGSSDEVPCAAPDVRVLRAPIGALVEVFRRRPLLSVGSWWRAARVLQTWPTLDLPSGRVLHVPPGLINGSVPANESLFAFHLARVAVRLYAAVAPVLHADSVFYRSFPLSERSERNVQELLECIDPGNWRRWAAPTGSSRDVWLRRWLFGQTIALELGLHSFRELSAPGRVWKLDQRFANLAHVTSTQLFFVYYALDHCEQLRSGENQSHREVLLRRRLPAPARVNLPLDNLPAFTEAFGCVPGDALVVKSPCPLFQH